MTSAKRKPGQTTYTPELADKICNQVASGASLRAAGKKHRLAHTTFLSWVDRDRGGLLEAYRLAREMQADAHVDLIMDAAMQVLNGELDPNAARVAIDAMKWTASKLKPRTYGDRIETKFSGQVDFIAKLQQIEDRVAKRKTINSTGKPQLEHEGEA